MSEANDGAKDPQTGHAGHDKTGERFEEGKPHSHDRIDSKDERSFANNIADAHHTEQKQKEAEKAKDEIKPTDIARSHGNEPSRGAKIDEKLEDEEEAIIRKMDEAKAQSAAAKK